MLLLRNPIDLLITLNLICEGDVDETQDTRFYDAKSLIYCRQMTNRQNAEV